MLVTPNRGECFDSVGGKAPDWGHLLSAGKGSIGSTELMHEHADSILAKEFALQLKGAIFNSKRRPNLPWHKFIVTVTVELAFRFFPAGNGEDFFKDFLADAFDAAA